MVWNCKLHIFWKFQLIPIRWMLFMTNLPFLDIFKKCWHRHFQTTYLWTCPYKKLFEFDKQTSIRIKTSQRYCSLWYLARFTHKWNRNKIFKRQNDHISKKNDQKDTKIYFVYLWSFLVYTGTFLQKIKIKHEN